jgi:hypothetical protein
MATVTLVHPAVTSQVSRRELFNNATLFESHPELLRQPYAIKSVVSLPVFTEFVSALNDKPITITNENFDGLSQLSREFGFNSLSAKLAEFRGSAKFRGEVRPLDADARNLLSTVDERQQQFEAELLLVQSEIVVQAKAIASIVDRLAEVERAVTAVAASLENVSPSAALQSQVSGLESGLARVSEEVSRVLSEPRVPAGLEGLPAEVALLKRLCLAVPGRLDSAIVSSFPALFDDFRGGRFLLLWRGTRDGFRAKDFHDRCDGHANTLTLIQAEGGAVFGGFTPLEWESRVRDRKLQADNNTRKGDPTGQSFVFTLENQQGVPPTKFALRPSRRENAIFCDAKFGPRFGGDITIVDRCNENKESQAAAFGTTYNCDAVAAKDGARRTMACGTTDTNIGSSGAPLETLLAGEEIFKVRDIEVFWVC